MRNRTYWPAYLLAFALLLFYNNLYAITIDGDFTDWDYSDLKAIDEYWGMTLGDTPSQTPCYPIPDSHTGSDQLYLVNDNYDDSRDLVAFYCRDGEQDWYYLRVDFFDLKYGAEEAGGLDVYFLIDCASGSGSDWLPDYTDCQTDLPWDIAVCIYDSVNWAVKAGDASHTPITTQIEGPAFRADLDSMEVAIPRTVLTDAGWDGSSALAFQVFTTKDGTDSGAGELGGTGAGAGNSDVADAFVDDDRGWGDGYLNGSISSADSNPGRAKFVALMHGNQSFNRQVDINSRVDRSTDPEHPVLGVGFYRTLDIHEQYNVPVELHLSGILTHALQWANPEFNQRIKEDVQNGVVDLFGGVYAEHIMTFFNGPVNSKSVQLGTRTINEVYGIPIQDIIGFWTPERIARDDTFEEILRANADYNLNYKFTVLDEFTHHRDWFGFDLRWDTDETNDYRVDMDYDEHKIHVIDGVKVFFIDRYAQKWKIETMVPKFYDCTYEASPQIGLRGRLMDLALSDDQEQVMVCMEDWEDWVGEPYRAVPSSRNPDGWDVFVRYFANHQWIHVTTTTRIIQGEVDIDGDGVGDQWGTVTDQKLTDKLPPDFGNPMPPYWLNDELPMNSYTWVRDASEGNYGDDDPYPSFSNIDDNPTNDDWDDGYQNWYWGSDAEESFKDAVPVLRGWRYGDDTVEFIPNGKKFGAIWDWNDGVETPSTTGIIPETWANIANSTGDPRLLELATYTFMAMIYETAWHDEATVRSITGDPADDDTKAILVSWVLPPSGHIRDANKLVAAAEWAASTKSPDTVIETVDVDLDGEDEHIMHNNKVFAIFENDGGVMTNCFVYDAATDQYINVIGAPVAYPDRESEQENTDEYVSDDPDHSVNRVSVFRDEGYIHDLYDVRISGTRLIFTSSDLKISKYIKLDDNSAKFEIRYDFDVSLGQRNVELSWSPNLLDMMRHGTDNLQEIGARTGSYFGLKNTNGGLAYVNFLDTDFVHADYLDRDTKIALAQRLVINGKGVFKFELGFDNEPGLRRPAVLAAAYAQNPITTQGGGELTLQAYIFDDDGPDDIAKVELFYEGDSIHGTQLHEPIAEMKDDGQNGDKAAGDSIYTFSAAIGPGAPVGEYVFSVVATDQAGNESSYWPYLTIHQGGASTMRDRNYDLLERIKRLTPEMLIDEVVTRNLKGVSSPVINLAGYLKSEISTSHGGPLTLIAQVDSPFGLDSIQQVELYFRGSPTGVTLKDDGTGADIAASDGWYTFSIDVDSGAPAGHYLLTLKATDYSGRESLEWPYWVVE